jgi:uncharacterized membrane protein
VITLGAIYVFSRGNFKTAWAILAIGTMTKLFPGLLAPLFLIYQWRRGGWRSTIPSIVTFAAIILLIAVPFLALDSQGFISSFMVQSQRALQLESVYSSLLLLGDSLRIISVQPYQGSISFDLASSLSEPLARFSFVFMGLGLLLVYAFYYWNCRKLTQATAPVILEAPALADLLNYSFVAIAVGMITSKVFSPQFMVWLLPLFPLVSGRCRSAIWMIFLTAACLTWYIYPLRYWGLVDTQQTAVNVLILRNVLVILMAGLLLGEKPPAVDEVVCDTCIEAGPASG